MTPSPPRALVTGAAGFIGHACLRAFAARDWRVTGVFHTRVPAPTDAVELVRTDLTDRTAVAALLAKHGPFDAIVNCAGVASDVVRTQKLLAANRDIPANLAAALAAQPHGRLVHISSTDVYGLHDFADADENTPLDLRTRAAYPRSKILGERAIAAALPPSRFVLLRPGAVCGPGDPTLLPRILGFLRSSPFIVHFGRWRGRNRWPLVHVDNVARAALLAATDDESAGQAINLVNPERITMEDYFRWVVDTFMPARAGVRVVHVPLGVAWPYACLSTLLSRALGRTQPLFDPSLYALRSVARNLDFNSDRLLALFARHGEPLAPVFDPAAVAPAPAVGPIAPRG